MLVNIKLDHVDSAGAIFTMTIVGDPESSAAGTYRVDINEPIVLNIPDPDN
jgi:hypothetical protein